MNPAGEGYKLLSRRLQSCSPDPDEFGMSSLTANLISDLCVFQTLGYQKQMDKLRASCWPRLCAQGTHRNSPFLLYAGWSCMRDPPRLWAFNGVETLLWVGWLRDWEHLIEGTSPNRKKEASLWEKKKREQCLLHVPDNGAIIIITVRASWPFGGVPEWRVIMCTIEAGCLCLTACEFWAMFLSRFVSEPARCIQFPARPRTYYINFNSPNFV